MIFKKYTPLATFLFSSAIVLSACGSETEVEEPVNEEAPQEANETDSSDDARPGGGVTEENIGGGTFGFTELDLTVDYPDQEEAIYISYEETRDQVEAEYKNELADSDLVGNDAMDEIEPAFNNLDIDSSTEDDQIIEQVTEAFEIEEGYESIEIEIDFQDGTNKEISKSEN